MNEYIKRDLKQQIISKLKPNQAVILYGARRVGKTTLIKEIIEILDGKVKFVNAENSLQRKQLQTENFNKLESFLSDVDYLIIDEAQKISNIGQILKIIVDNISNIKILATGSASFELANQVGEPLTGRKRTLKLYPISISELIEEDYTDILGQLEERLIFGSYPKTFSLNDKKEKIEELQEITDSYLYRDILELENIKNSQVIRDLLTLLALQVGSEVSLSELGNKLNIHVTTVSKYLDLLEKVFVIFKMRGFSRNLRKEVSKTAKYYFYDNGIRNALINNFNDLNLRNDTGELWENFLISERIKYLEYNRIFANKYFWRTYEQKEIDLIEEREGKLFAYEIKWNSNKKVKAPKDFIKTYQNSEFQIINKDNFVEFLT